MPEDVDPTPEALLEHAEFVRAVVRAVLSGDDRVEDAVQDTWVAALERRPKPRTSLRRWLAGVARRKAVDIVRDETGERRRAAAAPARVPAADPSDVVARAEIGHRVAEAVLALEEPYRTTVLLRFLDGLPPRSIARRMGVPVETVNTRTKRGLARLGTRLRGHFGNGPGGWRAALAPWLGAGTLQGGVAVMGKSAVAGGVGLAVLALTVVAVTSARTPERPPPEGALTADSRAAEHPPVGATPVPSTPPPATVPPAEVVAAPEHPPAPEPPPALAAPPPPPAPRVVAPDFSSVDRDRDLHGVVVTEDGLPVAGATLAVAIPWLGDGSFVSRAGWSREEQTGPTTSSREDGSFVLRLPPAALADLRVTAPGRAATGIRNVQAGERVRVVMTPGVRLLVQVVPPARQPVDGLNVRVVRSRSTDAILVLRTTTDGSGRAVLEDLPPGLDVWLLVEGAREGLALPAQEQVTLPAEGEASHVVRLAPGRTLRGRVVDAATRRPLAGARVGEHVMDGRGGVRTNEEGRYTLPGWTTPRSPRLHVTADGYALAWKSVGTSDVVDFALERGSRLTGRVRDARGAPVADARLAAVAYDDGASGIRWVLSVDSDTTDAEGSFALEGLAPGRPHVLRLVASGHGRLVRSIPPIPLNETLDLGDVVLSAPGTISARAVATDGTPLTRQGVSLHPLDPRGATQSFERLAERPTDDLGRVRFPDLSPGTYVLRLNPRRWPNRIESVTVPEGGGVVEADLSPGTRTVVVFVVEESGEPIAKMHVYARDSSSADRMTLSASTESDGRARFEVLPGVPVRIEVSPQRDAPYVKPEIRTMAPEEEEIQVVVTRTDVLSGTLLAPDGAPVAFGVIEAEDGRGVSTSRVTDERGAFRLPVPGNDPVTLRFQGRIESPLDERDVLRPWTATAEGVPPRAKDVVLQTRALPADRSLEVRVLDPEGRGLPGIVVRLASSEEARETDASGRALFRGLPALPVAAEVQWTPTRVRPWVPSPPTPVVPDGQAVEVRFARGRTLEGRVALDGGGAARSLSLVLEAPLGNPPRGMGRRAVPPAADGTFFVVIEPSDAGPFTLVARALDAAGASFEGSLVDVKPRQGPIEFLLRRRR